MMLSHKTLIFLGLLAAGANAAPTDNTHHLEARTQPSTLWRADDRTPAKIKEAQGFHPRNSAKHEFGLWNHLQFIFNDADTETAYVSTSSSKAFAERWAKSQFQTDLGGYSGYIYEIAPAGNMVDVDATLREYRKEAMEEDQYEFSAIGGIPWAQIKGWQKFTTDGQQGGTFGTYEKNPSFDGTKYPKAIAAVDYALSGFPKGHAAWKKDPWKAIAATCEGASTVRPNTSTRQKRETTPHRTPKKTSASGSQLPAKNTDSKVPVSGKKPATGKGKPGATSCKVPRSPKQAYMTIMKKTRGRLAGESSKVLPPKKATTPKKATRPNRASTST